MNTLPFKWRKSVRNLFQYQAKPASEKNCGHICDSLTMLLWLPYLICSIWCVEYVQLGMTFQFTVPLSFSGLLSHPSMVQFFPPFEFLIPPPPLLLTCCQFLHHSWWLCADEGYFYWGEMPKERLDKISKPHMHSMHISTWGQAGIDDAITNSTY